MSSSSTTTDQTRDLITRWFDVYVAYTKLLFKTPPPVQSLLELWIIESNNVMNIWKHHYKDIPFGDYLVRRIEEYERMSEYRQKYIDPNLNVEQKRPGGRHLP